MIGQEVLTHRVQELISSGTFPRFSIFVGPKGSGKKTFVREVIQPMIGGFYMEYGLRVDNIRELIDNAYKVRSTAVYCIPDVDTMSLAAKNAVLKVTEEPPNNAYFIMTLEDESNILDTVRSRATVFYMDKYTPDEIEQYAAEYLDAVPGDAVPGTKWDIVRDLCETPGDVETLCKSNPSEFYDYVKLVVDNIAGVSTANALKIPSKVALKDGDDGYNLGLFWKAFISYVFSSSKDESSRLGAIAVTSQCLQALSTIKGINRQMLMDCWVLEVRDLWKS